MVEDAPWRRFRQISGEPRCGHWFSDHHYHRVLGAVCALIAPTNPYDLATVSILDSRLEPGAQMMNGVTAYLGTDGSGRDMVSAMLYGLRISLGVGVGSGVIALVIGIIIGLIAAYFGGELML